LREDLRPEEVIREKSIEPSVGIKNAAGKDNEGKFFGRETVSRGSENPEDKNILVNGSVLKLTNVNKIFWPKEKYSKGDVIAYYRSIAKYILPYLKDRPESLHRYPNGIEKDDFFQKDFEQSTPPYVRTVVIHSDTEERDLNYLICNNEETLIYLANLGCIELNPWSSRVGTLEYPDYIVFDLDPEDISFNEVVRAALEIKKVLDRAGVVSFPKTSGATGLHILSPTDAKYTYEQVRQFSEIIVRMVQKKLPNTTSVERSPGKRQKKVYLDYLQNRRGQTISAPYCIRPREGAPVSTPLEWAEVKKGLDPKKFNIKTIFERLKKKGEILEPLLGKPINLESALKKLEA
jgi:bifunctional non-homologous end joining protein LigD